MILNAQWRDELTVRELIDRDENRTYSSCWQIPNEIFPSAIKSLREWCQQHYGSLAANLSYDQIVTPGVSGYLN